MLKKKITILLLISGLLLPMPAIYAATKTERLNILNRIINDIKSDLTVTHHKQLTLQQQLQDNEIVAGQLAIKISKMRHELVRQQALLRELNLGRINYQRQLTAQKNDLALQIRTTYMLGKQTYLRLLLNHQDPNQLSRIFVYYGYLQKSRLQLIEAITWTLRKLQRNKLATLRHTQELLVLQQQEKQEYKKLTASKQQHTYLLRNINQHMKTQQQKLAKLITNKKSLEKVIARLKISPISVGFVTPVPRLQHKLSWPTKGRIENLYGLKIQHSQLQWNGILIHAAEGQDVHAIATGKVVFAQWLQGYGLLLIINHGHGYMSLYGRNGSLYKKVGDIVQKGDVIATVGNSGGYNYASLYFAIRHNGEPVNPKLWCS